MIQTKEKDPMAPPAPFTNAAFLSRGEVSRLFGVSASTVTRWARQGLLKALRTPGGHYRFPAEETRRAAGCGIPSEQENLTTD
jgi:excisionase family DNA binding protein